MEFRIAKITDIPKIIALVNISYRSKTIKGWTSEAEIIDGQRLNETQAKDMILKENSFLILASEHDELIGCVYVEYKNNSAYIGLLTIHPKLQNKGLGKILLTHAEQFSQKNDDIHYFEISVLSLRTELIQFYNRRGYIFTGKIEDYPLTENVGIPINSDIKVLYLRKAFNP